MTFDVTIFTVLQLEIRGGGGQRNFNYAEDLNRNRATFSDNDKLKSKAHGPLLLAHRTCGSFVLLLASANKRALDKALHRACDLQTLFTPACVPNAIVGPRPAIP